MREYARVRASLNCTLWCECAFTSLHVLVYVVNCLLFYYSATIMPDAFATYLM